MTPRSSLVRPLVVLALMLFTTVFCIVAVPRTKLSEARASIDLQRAVPQAFADWRIDPSVVPLPVLPEQEQVIKQDYEQILSRTYVNDRRESIMLTIAYGSKQVQGFRAHRQEVCYAAQGFRISALEHPLLTLKSGQLASTRMVATLGPRVESVTYWFTMGDEVVQTYLEREMVQLKFTFNGYIPDGYLVRVSSLSADPADAYARHIEFIEALLSHMDGNLRRRLIGHWNL